MRRLFLAAWLLLSPGILHAELRAVAGVFDAGDYDFAQSGPLRLDGEWLFRWNDFVAPDDADVDHWSIVAFPGAWTDKQWEGEALPAEGFATYRLQFRSARDQRLALAVPIMGTAYQLYWNEARIASNGAPGRNSAQSRPDFRPLITTAVDIPANQTVTLTLHISNFHDRSGGPWFPIRIGTEKTLRAEREKRIALDLSLAGALGLMGFYHLVLFVVRRRDRLPLYFALFCLVMAVRSMGEGEKFLLTLIPDLPWIAAVRISYVSFFLALLLAGQYVRMIHPDLVWNRAIDALNLLFAGLSLFALATPVRFFSETLPVAHGMTLLLSCYFLYVNVRAAQLGRPESWPFLVGGGIFALTVLNDILVAYSLTATGAVLSPFGFLVFVFAQAYLLARRYARAFTRAETLSANLDTLNLQLEERVRDRNRALEENLQLIRRDLSTAKKIQQSFLPEKNPYPTLDVSAIYLPMHEVGGDIYGFSHTPDGRPRVLLADATGHGVQGALVTMALKSEFESISPQQSEPAGVLIELNRSFAARFHYGDVFFSAIVVDFSHDFGEIQYASAGHPDQWLISAEARTPLPKTGPIIGIFPNPSFEQRSLQPPPGSALFLFSDGAFEQLGDRDEDFGEERLRSLLEAVFARGAGERAAFLEAAIDRACQERERRDDILLLTIAARRH